MLPKYPIIKDNNYYIKVNILKKNKYQTRNNNNNTILRPQNSYHSYKSFNPIKLEKNLKLVENIRYNKYLIPMVEKKKATDAVAPSETGYKSSERAALENQLLQIESVANAIQEQE